MTNSNYVILVLFTLLHSCIKQTPYQKWVELNEGYYWADSISTDTMFGNGVINEIKGFRAGLAQGYELDFYFDGSIKSIAFWREGLKIGEERTFYTNGKLNLFKFYDSFGRLRYYLKLSDKGEILYEGGELLASTVIETTTQNYFSENDTVIFEVFCPKIKNFEKSKLNMCLYKNSIDSAKNSKNKVLDHINHYIGAFTSRGKWIWALSIVGEDGTLLESDTMHFLIE